LTYAQNGATMTVMAPALRALVAALFLLPAAGAAAQDDCETWTRDAFPRMGADGAVDVLRVIDDGTGPALYVGGGFEYALGSRGRSLVRFDGRKTTQFAGGFDHFGRIAAVEGFDDGGGFRLYAGGSFRRAAGTRADNVARWNGASWEPCGAGFDAPVADLAVFDDARGGGRALYAAGSFTASGARAVASVARWTGTEWVPVGDGFDAAVSDLEVFDDGGGAALYAIGSFAASGARPVARVARFDGTSWQPLGAGLDAPGAGLAAFDDGSGPRLFAVGEFLAAGGTPAARVARWNGANWLPAGFGLGASPRRAAVVDRGSGAELFVVGSFTGVSPSGATIDGVARWNGAGWEDAGFGPPATNDAVSALAAFHDDDGRAALYAGGSFQRASGFPVANLAKLVGSVWRWPVDGIFGEVLAFAEFDDGSGPALFIGSAPDAAPRRTPLVARWVDGKLTSVADGGIGRVSAFAVFDDGSGPALYAGGTFSSLGGTAAASIARWDGSAWSALAHDPEVVSASVSALTVFDDGSGPALYVGGSFGAGDGSPSRGLRRWDGAGWSEVGPGIVGQVLALAVVDDGRGPALFAGGSLTGTGDGARLPGLARWDGESWTLAGPSYTGTTYAIAGLDDGTGTKVAVGGTMRGEIAVLEHGRWVDHEFPAFGAVRALASIGTPERPRLVVGGSFDDFRNLLQWDGAEWSAIGGGVTAVSTGIVNAMLEAPLGGSPALFVGGRFDLMDGLVAWNAARLDLACSACRAGTVNAGAGGVVDVLFVNGGAGGRERRIGLRVDEPIVARLEAPPLATGDVPYAMYLWRTAAGPTTARVLPFGFGVTCLPTPISGGAPAPSEIWNTTGRRRLGVATRSAPRAPATLFRLPRGAGAPAVFYLQGLIADPGSAGERPASVTNGILVEVR